MSREIKLSLLYTFWLGDDWEMLSKSVEYHRPHVDQIIICYQVMSNKGEDANDYISVKDQGDHYSVVFANPTVDLRVKFLCEYENEMTISYTPDLNLTTKENERRKHNKLLEVAKSLDCTHFILSAADHFYEPHVFEAGKNMINELKADVLLTYMYTYYKHHNWRMEPIEPYCMPFIHKLYAGTEFVNHVRGMYPVRVDPSVMVSSCSKVEVMDPGKYMMHHYSMIRRDIEKKFRNAAASIRWKPKDIERFIKEYENAEIGSEISYFGGIKIVEAENSPIFDV